MKHEATAQYTEALVRTATRQFLVKFLGWDYLAVWLVMLASLIVLLVLGQSGWLIGALGAVTVIAALIAVSVWVTFHHRALASLRKMQNPIATFIFDDDGTAVSSDMGTGTLKWQEVQKLWCFPEAWLVFVGKGMYSTLPTACLTEDTKQFIIEKLKKQGSKISRQRRAW